MDIVEFAIKINRCEEIKTILRNNQHFENIQHLEDLVKLQIEKDELKYIDEKNAL